MKTACFETLGSSELRDYLAADCGSMTSPDVNALPRWPQSSSWSVSLVRSIGGSSTDYAAYDRPLVADSVEKGGLCWSRFQSFKNARFWRCYANSEADSVRSCFRFQRQRPTFARRNRRGTFQQNRPTAAARDWQLSTYFYHLSLSGRGIMYSPHWTITAASPACSVAWRT